MEPDKIDPTKFFIPLINRDLNKNTNFSVLIHRADPVSLALLLVDLKEKSVRIGATYHYKVNQANFIVDELDFMCIEHSKDLGEIRFYINTSCNFNRIWLFRKIIMPLLNFPIPGIRINYDGTYMNVFSAWKSKTHDKYKKYRFKSRVDVISEMSMAANLNNGMHEE